MHYTFYYHILVKVKQESPRINVMGLPFVYLGSKDF